MLNGDDPPPLLHGHSRASSLLQGSPPLSGASVLSASRLEPLAPFPLTSPARFSRSIQVDHRHCRPAANETMLGYVVGIKPLAATAKACRTEIAVPAGVCGMA